MVNFLRSIVKTHSPNCVFLLEKKSGSNHIEWVCRMLGFNNFKMVEARGIAGGLVLMWTDDVKIEVD